MIYISNNNSSVDSDTSPENSMRKSNNGNPIRPPLCHSYLWNNSNLICICISIFFFFFFFFSFFCLNQFSRLIASVKIPLGFFFCFVCLQPIEFQIGLRGVVAPAADRWPRRRHAVWRDWPVGDVNSESNAVRWMRMSLTVVQLHFHSIWFDLIFFWTGSIFINERWLPVSHPY